VRRLGNAAVVLAVAAVVGCAGPSVDPIDIHDPIVSVESRRYVADAEDAVSIARNGVDEAARQLTKVRERREHMLARDQWRGESSSAVESLRRLLDERVRLAEMRLTKAEAGLALAEAKLDQVYAETAVNHDLEAYDLQPIRDRVDQRLDEIRDINRKIGDHQRVVDRASRAWWKVYRGLLESGDPPDVFFASAIQAPESPFDIREPKETHESDEPDDEQEDVDESLGVFDDQDQDQGSD
jgi:hypothetical protein